MRIRVLGCHGGHYLHYEPISLLVDGRLLIDAGAVVSTLTLEELLRIEGVLVSHPHLDHVKDIAFMADIVAGQASRPMVVASIPEVLEPIRRHLLNDVIWPDFTRIPDPARPVLRYQAIEPAVATRVAGLAVEAVAVDHQGAGVGFLVDDGTSAFLFTGDTGPTRAIWEAANRRPNLGAVFIEASYPDRLRALANASGHLTPRLLAAELEKLATCHRDVPVFLYHMKPWHLEEVAREVAALGDGRLRVLVPGQEVEI
ncbi:MAG TPA: 3',5'-cyclic-nucleotide phosphodiesterase [Thermodesulfobacteriota bacterium]|nr:3',5'-cyclic-nucleotide phosphodiesterase [Thermodesulfobacteriota bacterium]